MKIIVEIDVPDNISPEYAMESFQQEVLNAATSNHRMMVIESIGVNAENVTHHNEWIKRISDIKLQHASEC